MKKVIILALVFRFLLIFINHPWDIQTFYNLFVDLGSGVNPYDTFLDQSYLARSHVGYYWQYYFEYYAYPPLFFLIYLPLAWLFNVVHPGLAYDFIVSNSGPTLKIPWDFNFFLKIPIFLADIGIGWLIYKLLKEGSRYSSTRPKAHGEVLDSASLRSNNKQAIEAAKKFLLNPYVIIISATWMFDSIMAFFLLLGVYLIKKEKLTLSSMAIAAGFLIKFVPLFLLPTLLIYIWKKFGTKVAVNYLLVFVVVSAIFIAPYWQGFKEVLDFHASRVSGGLTIQLLAQQIPYRISDKPLYLSDTQPYFLYAIPEVASLIFYLGFIFTWYLVLKYDFSLQKTVIIGFVGYLLFAKIVNEQYVLSLLPFIIWDMIERPHPIKTTIYNLLWTMPLAFAAINVPLFSFVFPTLHMLNIDTLYLRQLNDYITSHSGRLWSVRLIATAFTFTVAFALYYYVKETKLPKLFLKLYKIK